MKNKQEIIRLNRELMSIKQECYTLYKTNVRLLESLISAQDDLKLYRSQKVEQMHKRISQLNDDLG